MLEKLEIKIYMVKNQEGKWFRAKGYHGFGESWVDDTKKARIYTKIGPARSVVTYFSNAYPEYGIPDIVELTMGNAKILDEKARVEKAMKKKQVAKRNSELNQKKRALEQAQRELDEAQRKINELKG